MEFGYYLLIGIFVISFSIFIFLKIDNDRKEREVEEKERIKRMKENL